MLTTANKRKYYQALLAKNSQYEGVFYVGVKTTGVFCHPTCPAKKPKFENCEFFETAQQALLASFKPCKRCRPLSHPNQVSPLIQKLVEAVEQNPEKRWKNSDFQKLSVDEVIARTTKVVKLNSILKKIENNALSNIPTTTQAEQT